MLAQVVKFNIKILKPEIMNHVTKRRQSYINQKPIKFDDNPNGVCELQLGFIASPTDLIARNAAYFKRILTPIFTKQYTLHFSQCFHVKPQASYQTWRNIIIIRQPSECVIRQPSECVQVLLPLNLTSIFYIVEFWITARLFQRFHHKHFFQDLFLQVSVWFESFLSL